MAALAVGASFIFGHDRVLRFMDKHLPLRPKHPPVRPVVRITSYYVDDHTAGEVSPELLSQTNRRFDCENRL
jgi:hypothetical protein